MRELEGKTALVSGASRGIGRSYALALARAGARVVAMARSVDGDAQSPGTLAEVVATARSQGLDVIPLGCDLGDEASIVASVRCALELTGGIDVLVNNAIWPIRSMPFLEIPLQEWDDTYRINLRGTYAMTREVVRHMLARGSGSVINLTTASAQDSQPGNGTHGFPAYSITKAALERMTTYLAADLAESGIAVNAISPGDVARYIRKCGNPDLRFWGDPIVFLATQRPPAGLSGQILHTYRYGRSWGPKIERQGSWDPEIVKLLKFAGIDD